MLYLITKSNSNNNNKLNYNSTAVYSELAKKANCEDPVEQFESVHVQSPVNGMWMQIKPIQPVVTPML